MTLTNELGMLESERDRLRNENDSLKARLMKQAGAMEENRAQNLQLINLNARLAAHNAMYEKHFRDMHGSATNIETQRKAIKQQEEPTIAEIVATPAHVKTIKDRIASIMKRDEVAINGTATGNA